MRNGARSATAMALLPLLAGCWWLESEPGPGEWRQRDGTIGDFRPHHQASLFDADGAGHLTMECTMESVDFTIYTGRDAIADTFRVPLRYRLDDRPAVMIQGYSNGNHVWFRDVASGVEDPRRFSEHVLRARRFIIRIEWSATEHQLMRFDVSQAGAAAARLRQSCAEDARRRGPDTPP